MMMERKNIGGLLDQHDLRGQLPYFWFVHRCKHCGSALRRSRQHTQAKWAIDRGIDPTPWEIDYISTNGSTRCNDAPFGRGHVDGYVVGISSDQRHEPWRSSDGCFNVLGVRDA